MVDFNAKIGADNTGYDNIMGTQGLGVMNENGESFADLCALNQLVIGGSVFPHKRIHKATWRSPDMETAVNMLQSLFSKIWEKEEVPAQWKEGIVIKLAKKGDLRECSNY